MKNQNTKTQKGITLVALVITIIVLLILAAVAIGAIQNKGIIKYAQNASADYEAAEKQEQSVLASLLDKIKEKAPGNSGEGNEENEGTGNENEGSEGNQGNGSEGTGGNQGDNSGSGESGTEGEDEKEEEISQIPSGPWTKNAEGKLVSSIGEIVEIGVTTYTTTQVLEKLGLEAGEGKYNGDWLVLGLDGTKLKLVSQTNLGTDVTLGYGDPTVNMEEIEEIYDNPDDTETNLNLEKAIWSYNHAVNTLNNAAKEQTGITTARSITLEDLEAEDVLNITEEVKKANTDNKYGKTYKYYLEDEKIYSQNIEVDDPNVDDSEEEWSARVDSCDVFVNWDKTIIDSRDANKGNVVKLKHSYYYYEFTSEQSTKFANSLANGFYWLASPSVNCNFIGPSFEVRNLGGLYISSNDLFYASGNISILSLGVRAVVLV